MKLSQFSLRTLLVFVAIVAVAMGMVYYRFQGGWTVGRLERLIEREFNPNWSKEHFEAWKTKHNLRCAIADPKVSAPTRVMAVDTYNGANLGFGEKGAIIVWFNYDEHGKYDGYYIDTCQYPPDVVEAVEKRK